STLLNCLLGQKIVIVSPKAQTTRNKIQGIYTDDDAQIIFIDTPGIHNAKSELGKVMNNFAISSLDGVDLVCFMVEANKKANELDKKIIQDVLKKKIPTLLVINKVDLVSSENELMENINSYKELYEFNGGITISASSNSKIDELLKMIKSYLPIGPMYYPEDQLLDQPMRFVASEIIREKILMKTNEEVPHCVAVEIESFKQSPNNPDLTIINATIIVERESQKKIIIGSKGSKIKEIGSLARREIADIIGNKVYLELFVKVEPDWRNHKSQLKSLGYKLEE
ncbi:MAG: GTPase Era, partial [Bacilli bacterium]